MASLWLAVSWSMLVASWYPEAWRLKLLAIDQDPGTMSGPGIAHDLKLERNRRQLRRRRMTYFYCEFLHFFLGSMSFLTRRKISSIASAILFNCIVSIIFLSILILHYPRLIVKLAA